MRSQLGCWTLGEWLKLRGAPSNTIVTIDVHPYFPDNLAGWEFKFYDDGFVNTTIDCYEYVGLDHRANRDDVIEVINGLAFVTNSFANFNPLVPTPRD